MPHIDPRSVRPKRDWALVLCDKRKMQLDSGIFLPPSETGAEKVTEAAGVIVRLGPSDHKVKELGLFIGQHAVFRGYLKYANPIPHDETWDDGTPKEYFLMDIEDVFAVTEGDVVVGVFGGRPQVPEVA